MRLLVPSARTDCIDQSRAFAFGTSISSILKRRIILALNTLDSGVLRACGTAALKCHVFLWVFSEVMLPDFGVTAGIRRRTWSSMTAAAES